MRKLLVAAVLALVSPLAASAQVGLGAKLGISFPIGDADRGEQLKDITSIQVPLELSLNFHVTPAVKLGGYGGYAFAKTGSIVQDSCDFYGEDCTQHSWRAGVKGEVALGSGAPGSFRPYVGANWGWEWNVTKMEQFGEWGKMNISGWTRDRGRRRLDHLAAAHRRLLRQPRLRQLREDQDHLLQRRRPPRRLVQHPQRRSRDARLADARRPRQLRPAAGRLLARVRSLAAAPCDGGGRFRLVW